jgi:photosystem II stability/assembly factor-like uncharacterized protein
MSGRIADVEIHPEDRAMWYVAAGSGGVWKTVNNGTTWTPIFDDQGAYSIGEISLDPAHPDVVWVGTGENVSGRHVGYGDGVYKSLDGGETWTNMGLRTSEHIGRILVDPRDSDVVLVAAEGPLWSSGGERGVYQTTDGGDSWQPVLTVSDETGATDLERDPTDPDVVYSATYQRRRKVWAHLAGGPESGIWKSSDGGETWRELTRGLPSGPMGKINLAISPIDSQVIYATIEAEPEDRGFYRSEDGGETWEKRNSYVSNGTGPHYYQEIYASPHTFDRVYQMDVWMHVTDDGGRSFRELGEPDKHSDNHALAFVWDDPDYLLAGSDGGLYESYDHGASWKFVSNLPLTQIYKMAVDDDEPFYHIIGGTQDNGTLYGPSRTASMHGIQNRDWIVAYGADGYDTEIDPENPDLIYLTWQNGRLLRYDRRTREVLDIQPQPAPADAPERWNWDAPLEISPHSSARMYFGSQRLWRSDDRGDSWRPVSGDLSRGRGRYELPMIDHVPGVSALYDNGAMSWYGNTTTISESPLVEDLIYVGTDDGLIQITEDGGQTWRTVDAITGIPRRAFVNDIQASMTDPNTVFAVLDNHKEGDSSPYLVKSTDRGRTWVSIAGDLPERHILWTVEQDHVVPDLLFVGSEFGLFFTSDGGNQWIKLTGGVPVIPLRDIQIQRRESDLVAASFGRGFFVLDDYSPLRGMSAQVLATEAQLFPVRDALRYVPSMDLGARDKAYQGSALYSAPNPAFGAVFTYFLRDEIQTARERREAREAELRDAREDVPFPGWDALREESREREPTLILTVRDARGNVVRRVAGPDTPGIHRVAWNLRGPSPRPIDLDPGPLPIWADDFTSPMVAPGTYTVEMSRLVDGELRALAEPRAFEVRDFQEHSLPAGDPVETLTFQQQTAELQRRAMGASELVGEARTRLAHMRQAVLETPDADATLLTEVSRFDDRLADLSVRLMGDRVRGRLNEPSRPSILGRIGQVATGHWRTTQPPTATFRSSLEIAADQLEEVETGLRQTTDEIRLLEEALEAAGAPWTPGRAIGS